MAVLSIMMLLLFQFLVATQQTWALSESSSRIYENSRVAFDLIERDLLTAVTSRLPAQEIGIYIGDPTPNDAANSLHTCFVSSREPVDSANARLVEISYEHHIDPDTPASRYVLQRKLTTADDAANWDFYGRPADWHKNEKVPVVGTFERVVGGLASFSMEFYDDNDTVIAADTDTIVRPGRVVINMELFDEFLIDAPPAARRATQRAFTKVLFLNQIIQ